VFLTSVFESGTRRGTTVNVAGRCSVPGKVGGPTAEAWSTSWSEVRFPHSPAG